MKRSKTHIIIFVIVVAASLASYIFLNNRSATRADGEQMEQYDNESYEQGDTKMLLPDVQMVKKVLETGKRLLPTS